MDINLFVNDYVHYMEIMRTHGREYARKWLAQQSATVGKAVDMIICNMNASAPAPSK